MQLNLTTDYAIRVIVTLGASDEILTADYIGQNIGVNVNYLMKVLKKLEKEGLIEVIRGRNGGYRLAKSPSEISMYGILNIMEPTTRINRCLEGDCYCSNNGTETCNVRKVYQGIQAKFDEKLKEYTIEKILGEIE